MANADQIIAPPTLRVVAPKPRMTIYYTLLIIALVAMLTACLFLYLEVRRFGGFGAVQGRIAAVDQAEILRHREHRVHRDSNVSHISVLSVSSVANSSAIGC